MSSKNRLPRLASAAGQPDNCSQSLMCLCEINQQIQPIKTTIAPIK